MSIDASKVLDGAEVRLRDLLTGAEYAQWAACHRGSLCNVVCALAAERKERRALQKRLGYLVTQPAPLTPFEVSLYLTDNERTTLTQESAAMNGAERDALTTLIWSLTAERKLRLELEEQRSAFDLALSDSAKRLAAHIDEQISQDGKKWLEGYNSRNEEVEKLSAERDAWKETAESHSRFLQGANAREAQHHKEVSALRAERDALKAKCEAQDKGVTWLGDRGAMTADLFKCLDTVEGIKRLLGDWSAEDDMLARVRELKEKCEEQRKELSEQRARAGTAEAQLELQNRRVDILDQICAALEPGVTVVYYPKYIDVAKDLVSKVRRYESTEVWEAWEAGRGGGKSYLSDCAQQIFELEVLVGKHPLGGSVVETVRMLLHNKDQANKEQKETLDVLAAILLRKDDGDRFGYVANQLPDEARRVMTALSEAKRMRDDFAFERDRYKDLCEQRAQELITKNGVLREVAEALTPGKFVVGILGAEARRVMARLKGFENGEVMRFAGSPVYQSIEDVVGGDRSVPLRKRVCAALDAKEGQLQQALRKMRRAREELS